MISFIFSYSKALDMHLAVGILRLQNGLDCSHIIHVDEDGQINEQSILNNTRTRNNSTESLPRNQSYTQMSQGMLFMNEMECFICNINACVGIQLLLLLQKLPLIIATYQVCFS